MDYFCWARKSVNLHSQDDRPAYSLQINVIALQSQICVRSSQKKSEHSDVLAWLNSK